MGEPASANLHHPPNSFFMTHLLLLVNILLFLSVIIYDGFSWQALGVGPKLETLVLFGAKQNGLIAEWQLERLLVPMFLHANLIHLAFNMYAFYQVGRYLEFLVGPYTLLAVYLLAGLAGNLWSFAFIPSLGASARLFSGDASHAVLSVGASGSLFGILFFLFVLQKYQERLAAELGEHAPRTNLGTLIAVNAVLTFLVPNIDWACHAGGAVAGGLLGVAYSLRHERIRRYLQAIRFLPYRQTINHTSFWKRESVWFLLTALSCIPLLIKIPFVGEAERVLGRGMLAAANEPLEERELEYITEFESLLTNSRAETNPRHLLNGALLLHRDGHIHAASRVYLVVQFMTQHRLFGKELSNSSETALLVNEATAAALENRPLPESIVRTLSTNRHPGSRFCQMPAATFKTLGFFPLAGLLMECAHNLKPSDQSFAAEAVELYWRSNRSKLLFEFLGRVGNGD
jgi:rhomboid protease GluP